MILGEAAKRVPEAIRTRCPDVQWRLMAGMRDILAHQYAHIVPGVASQAITDQFPAERPALRRLLADLDAEAAG